jgi:hypothetical protein
VVIIKACECVALARQFNPAWREGFMVNLEAAACLLGGRRLTRYARHLQAAIHGASGKLAFPAEEPATDRAIMEFNSMVAHMLQRRIFSTFVAALAESPAVALVGPRQVSKATLAQEIAEIRSSIHLDLESQADRAKLADPEPCLAQHEDKLVILDEVQRAPRLFRMLRGPEQVDVALATAVLLDGVLEAPPAPVAQANTFKDSDPVRNRLLALLRGVLPLARKRHGAGFDFVPGQGHGGFVTGGLRIWGVRTYHPARTPRRPVCIPPRSQRQYAACAA